ncbi:exosortase F system-associated protein [Flavobacterium sp. TAB 87]|uniref:exosortase F system-associated membrane protein n=1 Tax=Flavobacterium sp. TAB 87 TaxID=1729581 RepID=UPI00076C617A|nr:exosortase F system-associated protein [Flavobacterium sp. TAB 87]KVV14329.1 exosortase F-associated protein [Flavobacterium sp. TAB 87]
MQINKKGLVLKIAIVTILVVGLAIIRAFEDLLFYDPFLNYFKEDFKNSDFPAFDGLHLGFNITLRYVLNAIFSLGIIYAIFRDESILKFSTFLYIIFFIILIGFFYAIIYLKGSESAWLLFYVRRFLIQPLFVLLFVPAFYYQLLKDKK